MRVNPYYNKDTMNLKQLALDLKKQGFICRLSKDCDTLIIQHFNYYFGFVEISMTDFKDWRVLYYEASKREFIMNPQKGVRTYSASTNWGVIKLLRKLLKDTK
jgi:hypothetical protein